MDVLEHIIAVEVSRPDWFHVEDLELEDAFSVTYWRLPLDPTSFEEKFVAIGDFVQQMHHQRNPWATFAYFSKRLAVFAREDIITITNNPSHLENAVRCGVIDP